MTAALLIARKDLLQRIRDRTAFILGVVAPAALAAILSLALGGAEELEIELVVVNQDEGAIARDFLAAIRDGGVTLTELADRPSAERSIADEQQFAAIVIPAGFTEGAMSGAPVEIEVLRHPGAPITAAVAEAIAGSLTGQVATTRLAAATTIAAGGDAGTAEVAARLALELPAPITIDDAGATSISGASVAYFGAAMAIFFLYFTVQFGARSLLNERDTHALQRLLAAPISRPAILGGKALASVLFGLASIAVVIALTAMLLGASYGAVGGVVALSVAIVLAVTAVVSAVTALAQTPEQADGYSTGVAIVFALIGGNFIDLTDAPGPLRVVSKVTPNGWALDGYDQLARGAELSDIAGNLGVLVGMTIVIGIVAAARARALVST